MRELNRLALCFLAGCTILTSGWIYQSPGWSRSEAQKILQDSPWSQRARFLTVRTDYGGSTPREIESSGDCTVRLFSALPVREAYVRLFQLMGRYDQMSPDRKLRFDKNYSADLADREAVIVNLDIESEDAGLLQQISYYLDHWRTEQFHSSVSLNVPSIGSVALKRYVPPDPDGTGAKFFFPRHIEGRAVISTGDEAIQFELVIPGTDAQIAVSWNPAELEYKGQLEY